ncbi:ABC transporter ATP-binding protein [Francisella salimarina]|uniref:ABC transporter ATP-binding protein n=1 Tax=Francisella salimarina TaxID=2599927 RepID=A0AAJ4NNP4_9GAMM|nr:ABC transporter ATP-binding protein [Francisella salimarina]QWU99352.1 ABC transporter ATP-binding protein [Francisella salimarina]
MFSNEKKENIAIRVKNVSKAYEIYSQPIDRLKQIIFPRIRKLLRLKPKSYCQKFWALKDISFEIKKGDTVGIIGLNGSGKSTLLQIICGTLSPTEGTAHSNGRVAALLELGSGFNPEFTGRENVYLNASILGLTEEEITDRFDKIIEFADIGDFIEQPVKTYSSGMVVRLAFAVIAHVDADILVVDEALAVGDAVFTQKCMRFIRRFQKRGTLLFVSHDTSSVINLCKSVVWLSEGSICEYGPSKIVSENYLQYTLQKEYGDKVSLSNISETGENPNNVTKDLEEELFVDYNSHTVVCDNVEMARGWETGHGKIISVAIERQDNEEVTFFRGGEKVRLLIKFKADKHINKPIIGFLWRDKLGQDLFGENTLPYTNLVPTNISIDKVYCAKFEFTLPMLPNGKYTVCATLGEGSLYEHVQHHWLHDALIVNVSSSKVRWGLVGVQFDNIKIKSGS